jgi:hypothetical protein
MSLLHDFNWDNGDNLEEIVIWTTNPMNELLTMYDEYTEEMEDKRLTFFYYALREKLDELEETIYKWLNQKREQEKKIVNMT